MISVERTSDVDNVETALPSVSVIVPTFNREVTLKDTLAALLAQDYPLSLLEIIVVDNSSTDDTEGVVRAAKEGARCPVRYFRVPNRGPAVARNYGVARARGEILAFTDSDCTMLPTWIRHAVFRMEQGTGLVTGPVRPVINPRRIPCFFYHQTDHSQPNGLFPTANAIYRREAFERAGGFDEQFSAYPWGTPVGGEDTDLAWRVQRAGYRAIWVADVSVDHEASSMSARAWLLEPVRAQIMPRLAAQIPGLRDSLPWRYFSAPENPFYYLALLGIALTALARRPLALTLAVPWLWIVHPMIDRDLWPPSRWWRIPVKYGLTALRSTVLAGILVYASLRYRRVVL